MVSIIDSARADDRGVDVDHLTGELLEDGIPVLSNGQAECQPRPAILTMASAASDSERASGSTSTRSPRPGGRGTPREEVTELGMVGRLDEIPILAQLGERHRPLPGSRRRRRWHARRAST